MNNNQRDFNLETVLAVTTGMCIMEDDDDVFEFYQFVYMDPLIGIMSIQILKNSMINHIFKIHPELRDVVYDSHVDGELSQWLNVQKAKFGDRIPISVINQKLEKPEKEKVKKLEYCG